MKTPAELVEFETMLLMRHTYAQTRRPDAETVLDRGAYLLLSRVQLEGPVTIGQLSDALDLDVSTLNRQTAALMRGGLLDRIPDPDGGIARKFILSSAGVERVEAHRASNIRSFESLLKDWTPQEIETFALALARLNRAIEQHQGHPWPRPSFAAPTPPARPVLSLHHPLLPPRHHPVCRDTNMAGLDGVEFAIAELGTGRPIVVVDDEDRENEGDIIFAAELATAEVVSFTVRNSSGYVCVPLTEQDADRLELPPMAGMNTDPRGTAYAVAVDLKAGVGTGISAADRAATIRALADPASAADDFTRPGHVIPLRACEGGVLVRPGHTEAAVDLAVLAGLRPAAVLCEVVSQEDPLGMARLPELRRFCDTHDLALISIAQLVALRLERLSGGEIRPR